jgi:DNA-3-methyladenine glycosylase I
MAPPPEKPPPGTTRCPWARADDALMTAYHDTEWGVPVHDDRHHFELIVLETAQAGLSWRTVLAKRDAYRRAFSGFDPRAVASYDAARIEALCGDAGIIRNEKKIRATVTNAAAFLGVAAAFTSFDDYVWSFVDGVPVRNGFTSAAEVPAQSPLSVALSTDLRRRGFSFVGPVVCYAYLQSAGLVLDHLTSCPRWTDLRG